MICDIVVVRRSLWYTSRENRFIPGPDCWEHEESGDANNINKRIGSCPAMYQKLERIVNNKEKDF
jgi:hypothetical protein